MTTDNQGGYLATFLPVGTYTVAVEKPGFRKAVFTGTVLQVDQQIRLDISLEVGAVNQEVTVVGVATRLQTEGRDAAAQWPRLSAIGHSASGRQQRGLLGNGLSDDSPSYQADRSYLPLNARTGNRLL